MSYHIEIISKNTFCVSWHMLCVQKDLSKLTLKL